LAKGCVGCRFVTGAGPGDDKADINSTNLHQYHTTIGQQASTTGNIYGIYDMAGGTYEYVMGNYNSTQSTTYMATMPSANHLNLYKTTDTPPFNTKPSWSSDENSYRYYFDVCTRANCGGQANYETTVYQSVSGSNQSWGSDYSNFVNLNYPWFIRGGSAGNGSGAGLFYSDYDGGTAFSAYGFRVSLSRWSSLPL
jgi:hypothetical protein